MQKRCEHNQNERESNPSKLVDGEPEDTRIFKGYWFEIFTCKPKIASISHIQYECNPTSYEDWKHQQGNNPLGYDGVVTLPNGKKLHLEMKYRKDGEKVYHNWFARDWLTRDADIYVTNNVEAISYWDKHTLDRKGKKLMSPSEAVVYISALVHRILHPNQYSYWNSLVTSIVNVTRSVLPKIASKSIVAEFKTRFKRTFLGDKITEKGGHPVQNQSAVFFPNGNARNQSNQNFLENKQTKDVSNHEKYEIKQKEQTTFTVDGQWIDPRTSRRFSL